LREHGSPVEQVVPDGRGEATHPPFPSHDMTASHSAGGGQVYATPAQTPPAHVSPRVQAIPSSHTVPTAFSTDAHAPVAGSHTPASWHWSGAGQTIGSPPMQSPAVQASAFVQALPSSHGAPSALGGELHSPVCGLQTPASWQASTGWQFRAPLPTHVPDSQRSTVVHALPSSHAVPSGFDG
jgi:hypothetical protein